MIEEWYERHNSEENLTIIQKTYLNQLNTNLQFQKYRKPKVFVENVSNTRLSQMGGGGREKVTCPADESHLTVFFHQPLRSNFVNITKGRLESHIQ